MSEVEPLGATVVDLLKRGPGRPPGQKKSGGRRLGSRNKRTVAGEQVLKPLVPGAKRRIKALLQADDPEIALKCAQLVLSYVFGKPTERRELTGPDGKPLHEPVSDRELDSLR